MDAYTSPLMKALLPGSKSFAAYVAACAFLHDDWNPAEGLRDWGQYDTNPFLLGAPVCVVNSLRGFGSGYTAYLKGLQSYPDVVIVPEARSHDLTFNLLHDPRALGRLQEVMQARGLNLSCFYPVRYLAELRQALRLPDRQAELFPLPDTFAEANTMAGSLDVFARAGVPYPESCTCQTLSDLLAFARQPRAHREVMVKSGHRKNHIFRPEDIEAHAAEIEFPAVAETYYPHRRSPSVNAFANGDQPNILFSTQQFLRNSMNWGNDTAVDVPPDVRARMVAFTRQVAGVIGKIEGVFGVDYIETEAGELLAVDLNPRFCSPTYPFYFLQRMGFDLDVAYAHYRVVPCSLDSLSDLLAEPDYLPIEPGCRAGMFVYNPVVYNAPRPVEYCSYVVVSDDPQHLVVLENRLLTLLGQH